jgi:hypothetical protein
MSQTIVLSNGDLVNVPAGANPIIFARIEETKLFLAAHPKPKRKPAKTTRKALSGRPSQRSQKAAMDSAVGWAMAETVRRVRSEIKPVRDDIPFDPQGGGGDSGEELTFASSADLWPDDYGLGPER